MMKWKSDILYNLIAINNGSCNNKDVMTVHQSARRFNLELFCQRLCKNKKGKTNGNQTQIIQKWVSYV